MEYSMSENKHSSHDSPHEVIVDVIIPVRNGVEYLSEAIGSVLNQTMPNFRLVVVDNNSTDGTTELIRSFSDLRIETIKHSTTLSLFENLNYCFSLVRAPFFCLLHADDRFFPTYLDRMISALEAESRADLACCQVATINELGSKTTNINYFLKNILKSNAFWNGSTLINSSNLRGLILRVFNFVVTPSILYRREVVNKIGIFRCDLSFFGDLEYLVRGLSYGSNYLIVPQRLFEYRLHEKQETSNLTKNLFKYKETLKYFSERFDANMAECHTRPRRGRSAAEARVALVVIWDYMNTKGAEASRYRSDLIGFLLEEPILLRYAFMWRFLGRGINWSRTPRKVICCTIIYCILLPLLAWRLVRT